MTTNTGRVYLVGAGPGNPELITQKAIYLLKKADLVLYDFLVHPSLLSYCPPNCKLTCVGKRKGFHSTEQEKINEMMIDAAKQGKIVVRLKGGDPFIFGRAGEELTALLETNIPYECVPGVSSAIAAPEYSGIPLTHRELSRSAAFVTGTLKKGQTHLNIPEADTLVFLMALSNLDEIVTQLLARDRYNGDTAIAIITHGTLSKQQTVSGTLSTISKLKSKLKQTSPALIVVGDVVELSKTFDWRPQLPLFGKRFILLRPKDQNLNLAQELMHYGADVVTAPIIEIKAVQKDLEAITKESLERHSDLVFTSANAASLFMSRLFDIGLDCRALARLRIIVIGEKSSTELLKFGISADIIATTNSQEGILDELEATLESKSFLLPMAKEGRLHLKTELQKRGASVTQLTIYEHQPLDPDYFQLDDNDFVLFSSGSIVKAFFNSQLSTNSKINAIVFGKTAKDEIKNHKKKAVFDIDSINTDTILGLFKR